MIGVRAFYVCGRCGRKGCQVREPSGVSRRIMDNERDFWLRELACRYCKAWTPLRPGDDLETVAEGFGKP